jgi:hypothetical protein
MRVCSPEQDGEAEGQDRELEVIQETKVENVLKGRVRCLLCGLSPLLGSEQPAK